MQIVAIRTPWTVTQTSFKKWYNVKTEKNIIIAGLPEAPERTAKSCSIYSDKTPKQVEYYKERKKELTDRTNRGETKLKIKYCNGVPKIVSLNWIRVLITATSVLQKCAWFEIENHWVF